MAYHEDLIEHAYSLANNNFPGDPQQVDLRRAVSAAYYGLFHLLTSEAAENWKHASQRHRFARMFDHGRMKQASKQISSRPIPVEPVAGIVAKRLKLVADSFMKLQQLRQTADYDNSREWSRAEVWEVIVQSEEAIHTWALIKEEEAAQEYLFELMGTR